MKFLEKLFGKKETPPDWAFNLGRNDECWCGSGKKYKKCHRELDQTHFSKILARACKSPG